MPTIGLFSGKRIKELARKKQRLTRTQTAIQARDNILRKYKKIIDSRRYYYGGSNNWILYSKAKDAQRTGNVTNDKKKWAKRPHKYDLEGVDTKGGYSSRGPYFGKDLSKGKYSPKINTKRNVLAILKRLYPRTQFIVLGEWGYKNIGVVWTGGPTVKALEKLDMARGLSKKRNWVLGIDVDFRRESKKDFLASLDAFVRNKDRSASSKASTTLPLSAKTVKSKRVDNSKFVNLFRKYMKACNVKQVNGEILVTCINKPAAIDGVKLYLDDTGHKNDERVGKVIIVGGPSVSFKTKPPLAPFEGKYKDFIYKVDTKKGVIKFSHPKLTGMGDYTTGPTYFNVNSNLKTDIVELAQRMINKTLAKVTRKLTPTKLSQKEVRKATEPRKKKPVERVEPPVPGKYKLGKT
ncbi:MAG: hypothetical protein PHX21_13845 [bacterium]|nr:hypothetical protein [bacterium]